MKLIALKGKSFIHLKRHYLLYLLLTILVAVVIYRVQTPVDSQVKIKSQVGLEVGMQAPDFTLRNLNGNLEGLNEFKDKVVILNFWATWCAPCLEEMPAFEKLYRRYRSQGLTVIAVSLDKGDKSKVEKFVDEHSLTFPVLLDLDGIAERIYPSFTIPFTYVIDKRGKIAARVDGAKNWSSNETFAALDILIKR